MKITDEQLRMAGTLSADCFESGTAHIPASDMRDAGRASLEFWAPILLAKPNPVEFDAAIDQANGDLSSAYRAGGHLHRYQVARNLFSNRLGSVLAKPDPVIEAVREYMEKWKDEIKRRPTISFFSDAVIQELVTAVDAARAGQKEGK